MEKVERKFEMILLICLTDFERSNCFVKLVFFSVLKSSRVGCFLILTSNELGIKKVFDERKSGCFGVNFQINVFICGMIRGFLGGRVSLG